MSRLVAAIVLAAVVATARRAAAQDTQGCAARVAAIQDAMDEDARRTRVWTWSWMAIGTGLLAGQATLAAVAKGGDLQRDFAAGAFTSAFIPGILLVHPPRVLSDAPRLDARLALTRVGGRLGDPCLALPRAVELLSRDADDEALTTSWLAHALVIGGNVAVGLLLGAGFGDWLGAAKQAVGGIAVGEVQILTFPGIALRARPLALEGSF